MPLHMNSKNQTLEISKKNHDFKNHQKEEVLLVQVNHGYEELHKPFRSVE
jgi:hypothetical protein